MILSPSLFEIIVTASIVSLPACRLIWPHHFKYYDSPTTPRQLLPTRMLQLDVRIVLIMSIIVFGLVLESLIELRTDLVHWIPGIFFLGCSVLTLYRYRHIPFITEGALAVSMTMLFELEWLMILFIPFYLVLFFDHRTMGIEKRQEAPAETLSTPCYLAIVFMGVISAIAAELWIPGAI